MIGPEIDDRYMEALKKLALRPEMIRQEAKNLKIVYTPLHGTGNLPVRRVLKELGFEQVYVVKEQELPDGSFPTVSYPNPEDKNAFALALKLAKEEDADIVLEGVNPSCGDDIFLKLKTDGDTIVDGAVVGDGCAISQASADIMLGMVIGRKKDEALEMGKIFMKMIKGEASEEESDSLEEASALRDIAHMQARVKCAVLGWRTLKEALLGEDADDDEDDED